MKEPCTYTEKLHAHRLKVMLKREDPCNYCPKAKNFEIGTSIWEGARDLLYEIPHYFSSPTGACKVCQEFVNTFDCPCFELGREGAIKQTWLALEAKGYLK